MYSSFRNVMKQTVYIYIYMYIAWQPFDSYLLQHGFLNFQFVSDARNMYMINLLSLDEWKQTGCSMDSQFKPLLQLASEVSIQHSPTFTSSEKMPSDL